MTPARILWKSTTPTIDISMAATSLSGWFRISEKQGTVTDYIYPEDNEPEGIAAIDIEDCPQRPGREVGFNETEIASVDVLEDSTSSEAS